MKYNRILCTALPLCLSVLLLAGCGSNSATSSGSGDGEVSAAGSEAVEEENPFESSEISAQEATSIGSTFSNVQFDEDGNVLPFTYSGGTMEVEYECTVESSDTNVGMGFLVFLDGIPQPWQLNGEGDTAYMHDVELEEDEETAYFTISFTPVTGEAGDTLDLTVCGIFNPQYKPDMVTTTYYGNYHKMYYTAMDVSFEVDAAAESDVPTPSALLENVTVTSDTMPSDVSDYIFSTYGDSDDTVDETLEKGIYMVDSYNGTFLESSCAIEGDSIHLQVQLAGVTGTTLRIAVYADHELVSDGTDSSWTVTLGKGEVATLEADIDAEQLEDATTFYVIACCENIHDGALYPIVKGHSVLLYRQEN